MNDRKYCVYFHKRKTDGSVYYIGSGVKNKVLRYLSTLPLGSK